MIAAQGVLTSHGGRTSHAAVVARGMGKTCVCGAEDLDLDLDAKRLLGPGDVKVAEGDVLSIDGSTGEVSSARSRSWPPRSWPPRSWSTSKVPSPPRPRPPVSWRGRCTG